MPKRMRKRHRRTSPRKPTLMSIWAFQNLQKSIPSQQKLLQERFRKQCVFPALRKSAEAFRKSGTGTANHRKSSNFKPRGVI